MNILLADKFLNVGACLNLCSNSIAERAQLLFSFYGDDFLAKYIVNGEFLKDKVEADIADFSTEPHTALTEALKAYKKAMIQESINQLKQQNIKYDYSEDSETLIINVTAEEFKSLSLENISCYYIGASTSSDDGFVSTVGTNQ